MSHALLSSPRSGQTTEEDAGKSSDLASPVVLVRKKSGSVRFIVILTLSWRQATGKCRLTQEKTAFIMHQGLFEFRVMPFGLRNALQRLMQNVLAGLNSEEGPDPWMTF
jgi:hypothetical protein